MSRPSTDVVSLIPGTTMESLAEHYARLVEERDALAARLSQAEEREDGAGLICKERRRQVEEEGWTPEHDAGHLEGDLAQAAVCYVLNDDSDWPWDLSWFNPSDNRERQLVKAGALIAAEIDRLRALAASSRRGDTGWVSG